MLIGFENTFAIEFEIVQYYKSFIYSKHKIWINNYQIGNYSSPAPIYDLYNGLKCMIKENDLKLTDEFKSLSKEEIYNRITTFDKEYPDLVFSEDIYICGFGESFDSFSIRKYLEGSDVVFIWNNKNFETKLEIYKEQVALSEIINVFNIFEKMLLPKFEFSNNLVD